jgi:hypothetical protein
MKRRRPPAPVLWGGTDPPPTVAARAPSELHTRAKAPLPPVLALSGPRVAYFLYQRCVERMERVAVRCDCCMQAPEIQKACNQWLQRIGKYLPPVGLRIDTTTDSVWLDCDSKVRLEQCKVDWNNARRCNAHKLLRHDLFDQEHHLAELQTQVSVPLNVSIAGHKLSATSKYSAEHT